MSIIGILKIMEVQEDDMEVQEEAVYREVMEKGLIYSRLSLVHKRQYRQNSYFVIFMYLHFTVLNLGKL